jgi:glutamate synthase (NADPH) small chain
VKKMPSRQDMPKQAPGQRAGNFKEVALGYTDENAALEASRCIQCKNHPCIDGCPVDIDIPGFIKKITEGDIAAAAGILKEKNALPAVCGRVCPQEDQCEKLCILGKKGKPVAIGGLERYVAELEAENIPTPVEAKSLQGKKGNEISREIAVVGSGPSALTLAADLAVMGYDVCIYEAFHEPGGVLVYGIPEFRLPKNIVKREIEYIKTLGVKIRTDYVIGRIFTIEDLLKNGADAVYIATGAGLPRFMNIPGENLNGVFSANEFLTRSNLMKAYLFPQYKTPVKTGGIVAVVGGGNVAMDAARTALRLGADEVHVIYRRSRVEMPARFEEVENAEEEGILFHFLSNPVRLSGGKKENMKGEWVKEIECIKMELGEMDDSGRRRPIPIKNSEFRITVDSVIMAIGSGANPLISQTTPDLKFNNRGYIVTDPETGQTNIPGVYAGGDIVTGAATVIQAMGAGRRAAKAIHEYLKSLKN